MTPGFPWWAGLAPAAADVECSGTSHRIEWDHGELYLPAHADVVGEQVLAALGADAPYCIRVADLWRRHVDTVELVTLGRRPGEQDLGFDRGDGQMAVSTPAPADAGRHRGAAPSVVRPVEQAAVRRRELQTLLSLPGPFLDRLVLTVLARCAERWPDETFRADHGLRLGAALSARATPALRRFGERLDLGGCDVGISPARPGRDEVITARLEPGQPLVVSAEFPVAWLPEVWGRGLSEPDGELVLRVIGGDVERAEFDVLVADWEQTGAAAWDAVPVRARVVNDADGIRRVVRG